LLLAALAQGRSRLTGALKSDDTRYMAAALRQMDAVIEEPDQTGFIVTGSGKLRAPKIPLFLGNAGTATRFLAAAAAMADGPVVLTGDAHMQQRPIGPLITALRTLGVHVEAPSGCPPVTIQGRGGFDGSEVSIDARLSSQYVSALLMLSTGGRQPVRVSLLGDTINARGYVDITCAAMRRFGASVEQVDPATWIVQPGPYKATDLFIEPDASAATYLWVAEVLTGGRIDTGIAPAAFSQPDAKAHGLISRFPNLPPVIEGSQMQDAVPTLAALAAFNAHPVRFVGIGNLRVKECDRISAMATELSRVCPGLAEEKGDDLLVTPTPLYKWRACQIETYSDHRIAMSMALLGLRAPGLTILDPACVGKTYPNYWRDLAALGAELRPVV